jgi:riboflavin kinase/FMN adenylyltransferase
VQVIRDLAQAQVEHDTVLTIGAFDGLHMGHQDLLRRLIQSARECQRRSGVVTFDPLPRTLFAPDNAVICLTTIEDKVELLESWGVDLLIIIPFTWEVAQTSARDFVHPLRERARMVDLWVGWNFALGRGREGDVAQLKRLGSDMGFTVHVVEPVRDGAVIVSSTQIRNLLNAGQVREAAEMLGRFYQFWGVIVPAVGRERHVGFPTARLQVLDVCTLPASGVYAGYVTARKQVHRAVANIGTCGPSFEPAAPVVEVHLLDVGEVVSGERVRLQFVERLRDERRFSSVEASRRQTHKDIAQAREILQ